MNDLFDSKKGQAFGMSWLSGSAIGFIIVVIVIGIGAGIVADLATSNTTAEEGAVYGDGNTAFTKFSGKFTIIASILVLVFIIGLLGLLYMRNR